MTYRDPTAGPAAPAGARGAGDILALGFGTTVAMWAVGYLLWLPGFRHPAITAAVLLILLAAGGRAAGETTRRGWRGGLWVGLLAAALNLLVLGSLLTSEAPDRVGPSAALWLPGWLLLGALLGAIGGAYGTWVARSRRRHGRSARQRSDWSAIFCSVAAAATFCLLIIGGIVTGSASGLAVSDWPNSFGTNMFLFPLSRMVDGIYFEHAHRLFGSLVGLTALVLALHLQRVEPRRGVRALGWTALALVVVQGILGGLRVTGHFTLSEYDTAPSTTLAIVHGVVGQLVLAAFVGLAVVTSSRWHTGATALSHPTGSSSGRPPNGATDRALGRLLAGVLVVQLVLGSILRHLGTGLLVHIAFAGIVAVIGLALGVRAWGLYPHEPTLNRTGRAVILLIALQIALGIFAAAVAGGRLGFPNPPVRDVVFTTLHQGNGAIVLAVAVALHLWIDRLVPARATALAASAPAVAR